MAEEVTKTIENVDRLFARIVVNGEVHESQNYVPQDSNDSVIAPQIIDEDNQSDTQEPIAQPTQDVGEDVYSVVLNDTQHDFVDPETVQNLSAEVLARQGADTLLQQGITGLTGDVADINAKIPNQASSSNQLADKNFVNSSIATNTANFIGTFESVTQLRAYVGTVTNNDYAFVVNEVIQYNGGDFPNVTTLNNYDKTTLTNGDYAWVVNAEDSTKYDLYRFDIVEQSWVLRNAKIDKSADVLNIFYNRYKATVSDSTVTWVYEYTLNNSSFTAEQWATINSGLTQSSVNQDIADAISALPIPTKETVSASKSATVQGDMIYFVDTASVTLTLVFGSTQQVKVEVYAIANCTVTYYTDANTAVSLSMIAGTRATFVYFNGWKFNGVYGAVWD